MDPLSVTASIIAILQLTNKVITLCLDLHSRIKVRKELGQIIDEVDSLRAILQRLARQEASLTNDLDSSQSSGGIRLPLALDFSMLFMTRLM